MGRRRRTGGLLAMSASFGCECGLAEAFGLPSCLAESSVNESNNSAQVLAGRRSIGAVQVSKNGRKVAREVMEELGDGGIFVK